MKKIFKLSSLLLVVSLVFATMASASDNGPVELKKHDPVIYNEKQIQENALKQHEIVVQAYYTYDVSLPYIAAPSVIDHMLVTKKKVVATIKGTLVSGGYIVTKDQLIPTYTEGKTVHYQIQFYDQLDTCSYSASEILAFDTISKIAIFKVDTALIPVEYQDK